MERSRWRDRRRQLCLSLVAAFSGMLTLHEAQAASPSAAEVIDSFRDQWFQDSFVLPSASAWKELAVYRRIDILSLPDGVDGDPSRATSGGPGVAKILTLLTRTNAGRTEFAVIEESARGTDHDFNYFPVVRGNASAFTYYNLGATVPGNNYQESCRSFAKGGRDYLLCRIINLEGSWFNYQILQRQ